MYLYKLAGNYFLYDLQLRFGYLDNFSNASIQELQDH